MIRTRIENPEMLLTFYDFVPYSEIIHVEWYAMELDPAHVYRMFQKELYNGNQYVAV
jgi:hypothetical protein